MLVILIVLAIFAIMFVVEWRAPGRPLPVVAGWWWRAVLLNGVQALAVLLAGLGVDRWLSGIRPWDAAPLGNLGGAFFGYFVITFVFYWWHRWRHQSDFLWRWFHQVHHSPSRLEVATSFYKHPLEIVTNAAISSSVLYLVAGLTPAQAFGASLLMGLGELFYHWNVKTPYWVGFIFQRPESHCVHHQRGHHRHNYSDLPLWDMLFGTFHNPKVFDASCGFDDGREVELGRMLAGVDVNQRAKPRPEVSP